MTFDYPHRRILLEPNGRFADPFLADESGLSMVARGTGFHHFEIDGVEPKSPAAAAGVLKVDVILAVDGRDAGDLDLEGIGRLLQHADRTIRLSVERGGSSIKTILELKERL